MAARKVIPMKKRFQPNIALFLFLIILIYIAILVWGYLSKEHISIYEVNTTEISDDSPLYAFILRPETVVNTDSSGYLTYYNAEGSRVGVGDIVYTMDNNGEVSEILDDMQRSGTGAVGISSIREVISTFQNAFNMASYSQVADFHHDIKNAVFEARRENLYSDMNNILKSKKKIRKVTAAASGVLSYSVDGYENTKLGDINLELMDKYGTITRKQIPTDESIPAGSPAYKLVTGNTWSLVVKLNDSYYDTLKEQDFVRVIIKKDGMAFNAAVKLFDRDGAHFARLKTSRFMERYINDRFLEIEFQLKSASGLKIPNSSIISRDYYVIPAGIVTRSNDKQGVVKQGAGTEENPDDAFVSIEDSIYKDGNYYVSPSILNGGDVLINNSGEDDFIVSSKESLSGVYLVNQGFCQFRLIDVLYQNKEYTIVSDETQGGLSAYDHIVVDPSRLNENDFIE